MANEIKMRAFQYLGFEALNNGKLIPQIKSEVCVGKQSKTILEGSLPLEEALENLIQYKTRGFDDALAPDDRRVLLSQFDSLLDIIQDKRARVEELPEFNQPMPKFVKKKPKL
ncbi:hypothetical protein [Delftia acidovorans]|uniref:hypothetical protein n=1 Tax=Delftia acidovorans TaxID=80866 RepID=UPI0024323E0A|nr:hypothetical protein [Delftia acidovorans]